MPNLLDLDKARKELDAKDLLTIERETALTWGGRAAASYDFVLDDEEDHAERMRCFWEGETYRAEAVEHAAMTEDAEFVQAITREIEGHRAKARDLLLAAGHEFVQGNRTPKASRGQRPVKGSGQRPSQSTPGLGRRARPQSPVGDRPPVAR